MADVRESGAEERTRLEEALRLLPAWFAVSARALPWREGRDPYRVLVSELMLQQTRIEAVLKYYPRFLAAFPDVRTLAEAPEEQVLKLWEGLGYYSRARNLQKAARVCAEQYGGRLPEGFRELRQLPGLGDYTAGAVASFCFGEPVSAVDGNVLRVLARLEGDGRNVLEPSLRKEKAEALEGLYQSTGLPSGTVNEALMELGETLCLPKGEPNCGKCPWNGLCRAHQEGREQELPLRLKAAGRRTEQKTVLLLFCGGRVALEKRDDRGLLAGLYGFPTREGFLSPGEAERELLPLGLLPGSLRPLRAARHLFTHVEWQLTGFAAETERELPGCLYAAPEELKTRYAMPSAFSAYRSYIEEDDHEGRKMDLTE